MFSIWELLLHWLAIWYYCSAPNLYFLALIHDVSAGPTIISLSQSKWGCHGGSMEWHCMATTARRHFPLGCRSHYHFPAQEPNRGAPSLFSGYAFSSWGYFRSGPTNLHPSARGGHFYRLTQAAHTLQHWWTTSTDPSTEFLHPWPDWLCMW